MSAAGSLLLSSFGSEEPGSLSGQAASMAGKCPPPVPSDPPLLVWKPPGEGAFSPKPSVTSPPSTHFLVLGEKLLGLLPAEAGCLWLQPWQAYTGWVGTA